MTPAAPSSPQTNEILSVDTWKQELNQHTARAERWTKPTLDRRARGIAHPVEDFLFTYYFLSLRKLEQWHPGFGRTLACSPDLPEWLERPPYKLSSDRVQLNLDSLDADAITRMTWIHDLLDATTSRTANFRCHGLHEWAMVYSGSQIRHSQSCELRLPQAKIDELVESRPLRCTHFDAFRFFDEGAKPMNHLQPTLDTRQQNEQPGCVHTNMDLYKWAAKLQPWVGSALLMDCFELAIALRRLDMRASPYDLRPFGLEPVPIETPEGRRAYEQEQRRLSLAAQPLRFAIKSVLSRILEDE